MVKWSWMILWGSRIGIEAGIATSDQGSWMGMIRPRKDRLWYQFVNSKGDGNKRNRAEARRTTEA